MNKTLLIISTLLVSIGLYGQDLPKPDWEELNKTTPWIHTELYKEVPQVQPGGGTAAPSDAIVLFDGSGLDQWQSAQFGSPVDMEGFEAMIPRLTPAYEGKAPAWKLRANELIVAPGTGPIATKSAFGDIQLHIEWLAPVAEGKEGQQYSNSGVFLMGLYEVQILNSYDNKTYTNGQAGAVYKQHVPLVNASRPAGEWQSYDIIFTAPRFSEKGSMITPARLTVLHNGVLVQNNVSLLGPTTFIGSSYYIAHAKKLPLILQDHGDPVRFRNIWVREL